MPALLQGAWQPEQPFTFQRSQQRGSTADKLLVNPVQFRPSGTEAGALRRFKQMVFEVSYVDPRRAGLGDSGRHHSTLIGNVVIAPVIQQATQSVVPAADQLLRITARVRDTGSGVQGVRAIYTANGQRWQTVALTPISPGSKPLHGHHPDAADWQWHRRDRRCS